MEYLQWYFTSSGALYNVPESSGLYVIAIMNAMGRYTVVYVGQAKCLRDRVAEHFCSSEQNCDLKSTIARYGKMARVYWAEAPYTRRLSGMELFLFRRYQPVCNKIEPPADVAIPCSLP